MAFSELGLGVLFLATFLSATVIPFSSEAVLATSLAAGYDPIACLVIATAGNTLGGMSSYLLGYAADWKRIARWLKVKETSVMPWKGKSETYGPFLALLCWTPFIGDIIAVALGVFRVKWLPVLIYMTLGKGARYVIVIWLTDAILTA